MKDLDLKRFIILSEQSRIKIVTQMQIDTAFLASQKIMDYSLLLGIYYMKIATQNPNNIELKMDYNVNDMNLFTNYAGGLRAQVIEGPGIYYMGIIDILQKYNFRKKVEKFVKTFIMRKDAQGISCMEPQSYQARYMNYMQSIIISDQEFYKGLNIDTHQFSKQNMFAYPPNKLVDNTLTQLRMSRGSVVKNTALNDDSVDDKNKLNLIVITKSEVTNDRITEEELDMKEENSPDTTVDDIKNDINDQTNIENEEKHANNMTTIINHNVVSSENNIPNGINNNETIPNNNEDNNINDDNDNNDIDNDIDRDDEYKRKKKGKHVQINDIPIEEKEMSSVISGDSVAEPSPGPSQHTKDISITQEDTSYLNMKRLNSNTNRDESKSNKKNRLTFVNSEFNNELSITATINESESMNLSRGNSNALINKILGNNNNNSTVNSTKLYTMPSHSAAVLMNQSSNTTQINSVNNTRDIRAISVTEHEHNFGTNNQDVFQIPLNRKLSALSVTELSVSNTNDDDPSTKKHPIPIPTNLSNIIKKDNKLDVSITPFDKKNTMYYHHRKSSKKMYNYNYGNASTTFSIGNILNSASNNNSNNLDKTITVTNNDDELSKSNISAVSNTNLALQSTPLPSEIIQSNRKNSITETSKTKTLE